jgi:crotonobetainyl-CoA:carnitine CoA-transferase CaiB-like acyl-CoA transferase
VSITAYDRTGPLADRVGFGDDVAMTAGLAIHDARGTPLPCGDAIADPLTGLHAAVGALASYLRGGSARVDVAMHDVVSATMAIGPDAGAEAQRHGRDWWVPDAAGPVRIARPRARRAGPKLAGPRRAGHRTAGAQQ